MSFQKLINIIVVLLVGEVAFCTFCQFLNSFPM